LGDDLRVEPGERGSKGRTLRQDRPPRKARLERLQAQLLVQRDAVDDGTAPLLVVVREVQRVGFGRPAVAHDSVPASAGWAGWDACAGLPMRRAAKPGLMTLLIKSSRSSNGRNADFIAFTVNQATSSQP